MAIFLRFLTMLCVSMSLLSCSETLSQDSVTRARLKRVRAIISDCQPHPVSGNDIMSCIHVYAKENSIDDSMVDQIILTDGFGGEIIVIPNALCASRKPIVPYSTGKNRVDECGAGDDISR